MTSKNLFFNLMKEHTKQRLWTVALISLVLFFILPVQTALLISSYLSQERIDIMWESDGFSLDVIKLELQESFISRISVSNGMMIFLFIVFAVVCGISGFSYLHSRRKTDFYHSIPVRRETLFAAEYINGFLYTAVPYLVCLLISSVMIQVKAGQGFPWGEVFQVFFINMAFFLLVYSVVIAAVMMTGNIIVSMLGAAVFFSWGPGIILLLIGYHSSYYITFYNNNEYEKIMKFTSPIAWYITAASDQKAAAGMALWAALATVLITAICIYLYKKRPSEAAGRAMAFKKSQPVIKILLVVPLALMASLIFYELMGSDGWSIFGLVCGLVISYGIIEIIYNFDFKRLFSHKKQFALCAVFAAACLAFFRFDLSGFDSYVPKESVVESAGIYVRRMDADILESYMVKPELVDSRARGYQYVAWDFKSLEEIVGEMKLSDIASALEIGKNGAGEAENAKKNNYGTMSRRRYGYNNPDNGEMYDEIIIAYHLKSGKMVLRSYYMNLTLVRDALDKIYDSEEYKESVYPVLAYRPSDIAGVNYQEYDDFRHVKLNNEDVKARLLETYQRELRGLTANTRRNESPVAAIQFKTGQMQEMIGSLRENGCDYSEFNRKFYYPIYPSFTDTISILKECGVNVGDFLTPGNVEKIVMRYYDDKYSTGYAEAEAVSGDERQKKVVTITDKNEIKEILGSTVSRHLNCSNYLNELYTGVELEAYVLVDQAQTEDEFDAGIATEAEAARSDVYPSNMETDYIRYYLTFDYDKVPEFVKEIFELSENNMKEYLIHGY